MKQQRLGSIFNINWILLSVISVFSENCHFFTVPKGDSAICTNSHSIYSVLLFYCSGNTSVPVVLEGDVFVISVRKLTCVTDKFDILNWIRYKLRQLVYSLLKSAIFSCKFTKNLWVFYFYLFFSSVKFSFMNASPFKTAWLIQPSKVRPYKICPYAWLPNCFSNF